MAVARVRDFVQGRRRHARGEDGGGVAVLGVVVAAPVAIEVDEVEARIGGPLR